MKEITITLTGRSSTDKSPPWVAFEVPDTCGLLAAHMVPWGDDWKPHPSRWGITHVPSGLSLPVPYWCGQAMAVWYAQEFFRAARNRGLDIESAEPWTDVPREIRDEMRSVFDRDAPIDFDGSAVQPGAE